MSSTITLLLLLLVYTIYDRTCCSAHAATRAFVIFSTWHAVSLANHPLLLGVLAIGERLLIN